jgi:biotin carboxyl carrier protein
MTKKFRITVDGRAYNVSVDDLAASDASTISAPVVAKSAEAPPKPAAAPVEKAPVKGGPGTITSPIGGMVRSIEVEVGSTVNVGETVAIIEVMKMKTEVKSTIAGKVETISAKPNQAVETGEAIMTLAA